MKVCKNHLCKKQLTGNNKQQFCSYLCKKVYYSRQLYPDTSEFVECKICGYRGKTLTRHIEKIHHMNVNDYCKLYNCTRYDLTTTSLHTQISNTTAALCKDGKCGWQKGEDNPSKSEDVKNGRKSIFSKNYKGYDGLTDAEKEQKIKEVCDKMQTKMNENHNNPLRIDYYIARGYSIEEAQQMLKDRLTTFSLEICIEKFGEEEGLKRFNERQEKWQNTLLSKPEEEQLRILKAKTKSISSICGYSLISQRLFDEIYALIKNEYHEIFYATLNTTAENINKNFEYEVLLEDEIHRYFLDFYVKDNNKVIEFDGDYWHGEKRGNKFRDAIREENLKNLGFTNILHVKECDYNNNPKKVVEECVNFIRSK